MTFNKIIT